MPLLFCPTKKELIPLPEPLLSQLFKLNKIRRIKMNAHYRTGEIPKAGDIIKNDKSFGVGFVFEDEGGISGYFPLSKTGHRGGGDIGRLISTHGGGDGNTQWHLWIKGDISQHEIPADLLARDGELTAAGRKFMGIDEPKPDLTGGHTITIGGVEYNATLTKKE